MTALARFLGGSPLAVIVKLALVSLAVGWFLNWLDWTPFEVWNWLRDLLLDAWASLGSLADYAIVGAIIVVPVFLVVRLLAFRGSRGDPRR